MGGIFVEVAVSSVVGVDEAAVVVLSPSRGAARLATSRSLSQSRVLGTRDSRVSLWTKLCGSCDMLIELLKEISEVRSSFFRSEL